MKMKVSFGNFENTANNAMGTTIFNNPLGDSATKIMRAITNRCRVYGVFFFNTDSNEKDVRLYDAASGNYAGIQAKPLVYQTIVPRDQALSKTWDFLFDLGEVQVNYDIYDTPTGIYDTFPKPGFLFENGVAINNATAATSAPDPSSKLHYLIFYTE